MPDTTETGRTTKRGGPFGLSLVDVLIAVVVIPIIGALTIPRMSLGAAGTDASAVVADLATMRAALELYAHDHGGAYPGGATVAAQLTGRTAADGTTAATAARPFGPYLAAVPAQPVGGNKGRGGIVFAPAGPTAGTDAGGGWLYDGQSIYVNCGTAPADVDGSGQSFRAY